MALVYGNRSGRGSFTGKLARRLGVRSTNPRRRVHNNTALINWGCSKAPRARGIVWLGNTPEAVARCVNKIETFKILGESRIPTVAWTEDQEIAQEWLDEGYAVYERHMLRAHSGEGIEVRFPIAECAAELAPRVSPAPLYTRKIRGRFAEYRVHIVDGRVILCQRKRRMTTDTLRERGITAPRNRLRNAVRTYGNGWVFTVADAIPPLPVREVCLDAAHALGIRSGCVDVGVPEAPGQGPEIIEVNSAPALRSESVINAYATALRPWLTHR